MFLNQWLLGALLGWVLVVAVPDVLLEEFVRDNLASFSKVLEFRGTTLQ